MRKRSIVLTFVGLAVIGLVAAAVVTSWRPPSESAAIPSVSPALTDDRGVVESAQGVIALTADPESGSFDGQAKVTGVVTLLDDGCLGLEIADGSRILVVWPAGTEFSGEQLEVPGTGQLSVGSSIDGAGGFANPVADRFPSCSTRDVVFLS